METRGGQRGAASLGVTLTKNDGSANAKFGEVFQLRDADAFVGKVRAIGRIHIAQANDVTLDFNGAMPARNLFVIDDDIGVALPTTTRSFSTG